MADIAAVSSAGKTIWEMFTGLIKAVNTQKSNLFNNHIEPLQVKMTEIHKDYVNGFTNARKMLLDKSQPLPVLLDFLIERRRDLEYQRQMTTELASALQSSKKKVGINKEQWKDVKDYCESIVSYLTATTEGGASLSWYSYYIETVRTNIIAKRMYMVDIDVWYVPSVADKKPTDKLANLIGFVLNVELPEAWKNVCTNYASLRTRLL